MTDLSPETVGKLVADDPRADKGLVEAMAKAIWLECGWLTGDRFDVTLSDFFPVAEAALTAARSHGGM